MNNDLNNHATSVEIQERRSEWDARYREGVLPWDTKQVPPEVRSFWESGLSPKVGRAIDIGCGTGTNVRFLQQIGLETIGVDLSSVAIAIAQSRQVSFSLSPNPQLSFVLADVSFLPLHNFGARYILDIGCLHAIPRQARQRYAQGVINNLAPGGFYHLYAHCPKTMDERGDPSQRGLLPDDVSALFMPALKLLTVIGNKPGLRESRWYLLHKPR